MGSREGEGEREPYLRFWNASCLVSFDFDRPWTIAFSET